MGFLSRLSATTDYNSMRDRMSDELEKRIRAGGDEVFEILMDIWTREMVRRSRQYLGFRHVAQNFVIYAALPHLTPDESMDIMAQLIAFYAIKGFRETRFCVDLNNALAPLLASMKTDGGEDLNEAFRQLNPRSYEAWLEEDKIRPFSYLERKADLDNIYQGNSDELCM